MIANIQAPRGTDEDDAAESAEGEGEATEGTPPEGGAPAAE